MGATYEKILPGFGVGLVLLGLTVFSALVFSRVGVKE